MDAAVVFAFTGGLMKNFVDTAVVFTCTRTKFCMADFVNAAIIFTFTKT